MDAPQRDKLKALALAATPQDFDSAQIKCIGGWTDCPMCGGDGSVSIGADYCNYDGAALGVQFYGIGDEHLNAEAYYRAANPATVLALLADRDAMQMERDDLRAEVERLRAFLETECKGFTGWHDKSIDEVLRSAPAAGTVKDARVLHLTHERDLALRANRELAKDAERFQRAIDLEDNAETLYAAVMNNGRDVDAIRREFDAAVGAHTKAGKESA